MPYQESFQFQRNYSKYPNKSYGNSYNAQQKLLEFVLGNTPKNNPKAIQEGINHFCKTNWMMNVGEQKGQILKLTIKNRNPKTILQLGGYCGFSALIMAANSDSIVHSFQPNQRFASIAHKIHQHAGLQNKIIIHVGTIQSQSNFIKTHGAFDIIFIDHNGNLYLPDLLQLQKLSGIKNDTIIVGDHILFPGAPDYLKYFKESNLYDSVLYHSYLEYTDRPDAILVSKRRV